MSKIISGLEDDPDGLFASYVWNFKFLIQRNKVIKILTVDLAAQKFYPKTAWRGYLAFKIEYIYIISAHKGSISAQIYAKAASGF